MELFNFDETFIGYDVQGTINIGGMKIQSYDSYLCNQKCAGVQDKQSCIKKCMSFATRHEDGACRFNARYSGCF